jgi:hypothetical protein
MCNVKQVAHGHPGWEKGCGLLGKSAHRSVNKRRSVHEGSGQGLQQVSGGLVVPVEVRCGKQQPASTVWQVVPAQGTP